MISKARKFDILAMLKALNIYGNQVEISSIMNVASCLLMAASVYLLNQLTQGLVSR